MKTTNKGLRALTTSKERQEIRAIDTDLVRCPKCNTLDFDNNCGHCQTKAELKKRKTVILKRTYNQKWPDGHVTKFWRVTGPATHRNINSDLSIEGLKEWRII